jgi:PAS domain S-box-containing protein
MPEAPPTSFAAPSLPLRHLAWGMLAFAIPCSAIALWLLGSGQTQAHLLLAGVLLVLSLAVTPMLWWLVYRSLLASDRAASNRVDLLRGHALASDARLSAIIESAMDAVVVTDGARRIVVFNAAAEQLFGYNAVEIVGHPLDTLLPERFRGAHGASMARFAATGETNRRMGAGEVWARHADGREIPVEVAISKTKGMDEVFYVAILRNITERKRAEAAVARLQRLYAALLHAGQTITRSQDHGELFEQMCDVVVREGGFAGCWVGLIENERLVPVAQSNMNTGYLAGLHITINPNDPRAWGPSGTAVRTGIPYVCNEFASDPNTRPWRALAQDVQIHSSAAFPIRCDGEVIGTLNVYAAESGFFVPDMVALLDQMAADISYALDSIQHRQLREEAEGILRHGYENMERRVQVRTAELYEANEQLRLEIAERIHTEDALRRSDARFNEAQRVGRVGSWELDLVSSALSWSDEIYRIFEIDPTRFGASYAAFLEAIHPDDRDAVNLAYRESVTNHQAYEIVHRLLMRDGRVKHVRERGETQYDDSGRPSRSIGTVQDITAQVLAEQEIRRTHELLQAVLDSTPDWIFVKDRAHRFLVVNRGFAAALKLLPEDMIGRPDTDFWPPELCEGDASQGFRGFHHDDLRAFAGELVHNPHDVASDAEGKLRVFDTLKGPVRDADGNIYGVLGYARDVTERSRAEQEIRSLNESLEQRVTKRTAELETERAFMQTVLDTAGTLIWVIDVQGRVIRVNRALCRTTGLRTEDMVGRSLIDMLVPEKTRPEIYDVLDGMVATGTSVEREVPIRGADGALRVVDWTASVVMGSSGAPEYVVGAGMDVTERRATERALHENEQLLREVADNIRQVIFVRDVEKDRMIFVSPAYEEIWGQSRDALYENPRAFLDTVHPDDRAAVLSGLEAQAGDGRPFNQEYRLVRQNGSERWVWVRTFPIRDEMGSVQRIAGLAEDVTERRAAEETRLQHLRAQRDNLVREVHHRIKNNLQGVAGLLRNHIVRVPTARDVLQNAITQIHTVALVHGLQGRAGYDEVRLCDVMQAICDALESLMGTAIERDLPALRGPQCAHVAPDEAVPVSLIVNELVINAVKHRQPGSGVRVDVRFANELAEIVVTNRGAPLAPGFSLSTGKGLGTGLMLVRSLMPPNASSLDFRCADGNIQAIFTLRAPIVTVRV